jgi:hypothetical protein
MKKVPRDTKIEREGNRHREREREAKGDVLCDLSFDV